MPTKAEYPTGKYKFGLPFSVNQCLEFNSNKSGLCVKQKTTSFSVGNVVTVNRFFFDDKINDWNANIVLNGQNIPIPRSKLLKVDDSTPESQAGDISNKPLLASNKLKDGEIFTTKNVLIVLGIVGGIAGVLGILKWKKVI